MKAPFESAILLGALLSSLELGAAQEPSEAKEASPPASEQKAGSRKPAKEVPPKKTVVKKAPEANPASKAAPESPEKTAEPPEKPAKEKEETAKHLSGPRKDPKETPKASGRSKKALPRTVRLPEACELKACELFPIAEKLFGSPVEPESPEVAGTRVTITEMLSRQPVTHEELAILLGASGIYLFRHEKEDGEVLVATLNPQWSPGSAVKKPARLSRKFQLPPRSFDSIRKEVEAYISKKNRDLQEGEVPVALAADPRTSSIVVRAFSQGVLAEVEEIVARRIQDKPEPEVRIGTYSPSNLRAAELREKLLETLSGSQKEKISLVIPRGKNILLIRAPEALYRKIEEMLISLDVRKK